MKKSKVKVFTFNDEENLEQAINIWIEKHNPEILSLKYQFTNDGGYRRYSVLIFYKEY